MQRQLKLHQISDWSAQLVEVRLNNRDLVSSSSCFLLVGFFIHVFKMIKYWRDSADLCELHEVEVWMSFTALLPALNHIPASSSFSHSSSFVHDAHYLHLRTSRDSRSDMINQSVDQKKKNHFHNWWIKKNKNATYLIVPASQMFSLSNILLWKSLGFGLLVGQNKLFADVTSGSGKL